MKKNQTPPVFPQLPYHLKRSISIGRYIIYVYLTSNVHTLQIRKQTNEQTNKHIASKRYFKLCYVLDINEVVVYIVEEVSLYIALSIVIIVVYIFIRIYGSIVFEIKKDLIRTTEMNQWSVIQNMYLSFSFVFLGFILKYILLLQYQIFYYYCYIATHSGNMLCYMLSIVLFSITTLFYV